MALGQNLNIFILVILFSICHATKSPQTDLESCKTFEGDSEFFINQGNDRIAEDERIHLKFYLNFDKGNKSSVGEIFLSEFNKTKIDGLFYDIDISNINCNLYLLSTRQKNTTLLAYKNAVDLVPYYEPVPVEIVQRKDGTLLVYLPSHSAEPVIKYKDENPITIKYIRFLDINRVSFKWFHSCQDDGFADEFIEAKACECINGNCTEPGICTCRPGFVHSETNLTECIPFCTQDCSDGRCTAPDQCTCNEGYEYSESYKRCEPFCSSGCPNGFCYAPGECGCDSEYYKTDEDKCEPICRGGCHHGDCVAPRICECHHGYKLSEKNTCDPVCQNGCVNGFCIAPEKCMCNPDHDWSDKNQKCEPYKI